MSVNIFVATRDAQTFKPINKIINDIEKGHIIGQFIETDQNDIINLTSMMKPDILIVDDTLSSATLSAMVREMIKIFPNSGVIGLYSPEKSHHSLDTFNHERFMKIIKPYKVDNLEYVIDFLMHEILEEHFSREITKIKRQKQSSGKFLPFFSPKDSSGKTTVIVNLAWMMSQRFNQKVLILNLNSVFDDSDIYLNYKSVYTFDRIIEQFSSPSTDIGVLLGHIDEHPEYKNLFVLSASDCPSQFKEMTELENSLEFFLWKLEERFDWILIDPSPVFCKDNLKILELSEKPFVLLKNHIISIRNLEIFFEIIRKFGGDIHKFSFIATRLSSEVGIKTDQLLKLFGNANRFFAFIPSRGKQAMASIEKRIPMVAFMPESGEFFKVFKAMACRLIGKDTDDKHKNYLIMNIKKFFGNLGK